MAARSLPKSYPSDKTPLSGIATAYRGITFCSRLEAQWAAFFDIVDWRWVYEPISYRGWLPDFVIEAKGVPLNTLLCEVKPVFDRPEDVFLKVDSAAPDSLEILVLGMGPFAGCGPAIGWYRDLYFNGVRSWEDAVTINVGDRWGITPAFGDGYCRITGESAGGEFDLPNKGMWRPGLEDLEEWWGQAHALIQWKPRGG